MGIEESPFDWCKLEREGELLYYNKRNGETAYEPPEGYVDYDDSQDYENFSPHNPPEGADSLGYDQIQQSETEQYSENQHPQEGYEQQQQQGQDYSQEGYEQQQQQGQDYSQE